MEGNKILITEDSASIRGMLTVLFEEEGYTVISAADGIEALNKARSERPDLIVLDLMMPRMDGFKVCRMLKFDASYKDIRILMLTARSSANDRLMGEEVGADAYLVKPFEPDELLKEVEELLSN